MGKTFGPRELRQVEHNPWVLALAAAPILASVSALAHDPVLALQVFVMDAVVLLYVWRAKPWTRRRPVVVSADAGGLRLGERLYPRAAIRAANVIPPASGAPARVRVVPAAARPSVEVEVADVAEGRLLLHALGQDAAQIAARFRAMSRMNASPARGALSVAAFVGLIALGAVLGNPARGISLAVGITAMAVLFLVPSTLVVGADGVAVRWLFGSRFVDFADVASIERFSAAPFSKAYGVTLVLKSGERLRVPLDSGPWGAPKVAMVEERLREAFETWKRGGDAADLARLSRGEQPVGAWVNALRAMGAGADADMRTAPVPRDRLWRVLEDPQAEIGARAAAAVAIGGTADDEERARLRRAAEATAAPRLRIAIEAATADDDAAVEEALAAAAEEREQRRA